MNAVLHALPDAINTPELQIKLKEGENYALVDLLQREAHFDNPERVITTDGLRVEYRDGFGLIRSSNTTPVLVLRFEADNSDALQRIKLDFGRVLKQFKPGISLPF